MHTDDTQTLVGGTRTGLCKIGVVSEEHILAVGFLSGKQHLICPEEHRVRHSDRAPTSAGLAAGLCGIPEELYHEITLRPWYCAMPRAFLSHGRKDYTVLLRRSWEVQ
jgi:hypothetical protein